MMDLESGVTDLETRVAFQGDKIQALNDVLVEQQRAMQRMQLQLRALAKRQEEMQMPLDAGEDEAPPPHY
jgi:SlyX protein